MMLQKKRVIESDSEDEYNQSLEHESRNSIVVNEENWEDALLNLKVPRNDILKSESKENIIHQDIINENNEINQNELSNDFIDSKNIQEIIEENFTSFQNIDKNKNIQIEASEKIIVESISFSNLIIDSNTNIESIYPSIDLESEDAPNEVNNDIVYIKDETILNEVNLEIKIENNVDNINENKEIINEFINDNNLILNEDTKEVVNENIKEIIKEDIKEINKNINIEVLTSIDIEKDFILIEKNIITKDSNTSILPSFNLKFHEKIESEFIESDLDPEDILYLSQIRVKLGYINDYMRNEGKFLYWRSQNSFRNDILFSFLEKYYNACKSLTELELFVDKKWKQVKELEALCFEIKHEQTLHTLVCDDRLEQVQKSERSFVVHNAIAKKRLAETLKVYISKFQELQKYKYELIYSRDNIMILLDTLYINFEKIESQNLQKVDYWKEIIENSNLNNNWNEFTNIYNSLRDSLSTLYHFESLFVTQDSENDVILPKHLREFRQDCRNWITQIVSLMLPKASTTDHLNILIEVMKCRGIGTWGQNFIQISNITSNEDLDRFLASLSLFLMTPFSFREANITKYILTESDYDSIFNQFQFQNLIHYLLKNCNSNKTQLINGESSEYGFLFHVMDTVFFILRQSLSIFSVPTHRTFARRIAQTIVSINQLLSESINNSTDNNNEKYLMETYIKSCYAILESNHETNGIITLLGGFSLEDQPKIVSYAMFLNFYLGKEYKTLTKEVILNAFQSLNSWKEFSLYYRKNFFHLMITNPQLFTIIPTFSQIAKKSLLLSRIVCYELMHLLFLNQKVEGFGFFKEALPEVSNIFHNYPHEIITDILDYLLEKLNQLPFSLYMKLLKNIPLNRWDPTVRDIQSIVSAFQSPIGSHKFRLAEIVISRMITLDLNDEVQMKLLLFLGDFSLSHFKSSPKGFFKQLSERDKSLYKWIKKMILKITTCEDDGNSKFTPLHPLDEKIQPLIQVIQDQQYLPIWNIILYTVINLSLISESIDLFHLFNSKYSMMKKFSQQPDNLYFRTIMDTSLRLHKNITDYSVSLFPEFIELFCLANPTQQQIQIRKHFSRNIIMKMEELLVYQQSKSAENFAFFWMNEFLLKRKYLQSLDVLEDVSKFCIKSGIYINILEKLSQHYDSLADEYFLENIKLFTSYPQSNNIFKGNKNVFKQVIKPNLKYSYFCFILLMSQAFSQQIERKDIGFKVISLFTPIQLQISGKGSKHAIYKVFIQISALSSMISDDTLHIPFRTKNLETLDSILLCYWKLFFDLLFEHFIYQNEDHIIGIQYLNIPNCRNNFYSQIKNYLKNLSSKYSKHISSDKMSSIYKQIYDTMLQWVNFFETQHSIKVNLVLQLFNLPGIITILNCINTPCFMNSEGLLNNLLIIPHIPQNKYPFLATLYPTKFESSEIPRFIDKKRKMNIETVPLDPPSRSKNNIQIFSGDELDICSYDELSFIVANVLQKSEELIFALEKLTDLNYKYVNNLLPKLVNDILMKKTLKFQCSDQCKGPRVINIQETLAIENTIVRSEINQTLQNVESIYLNDYFPSSYTELVIKLEMTIIRLIQHKKESLGKEYFFVLCSLLESTHDLLPGMQLIKEVYMFQLSQVFIKNSQEATIQLFNRMIEHPKSIMVLSPFFHSDVCKIMWSSMLIKLFQLYHSNVLTINQLMHILSRFNMQNINDGIVNIESMNEIVQLIISEIVSILVSNTSSIDNLNMLLEEWFSIFASIKDILPFILLQVLKITLSSNLNHNLFTKLIDSMKITENIDIQLITTCSSIISNQLWELRGNSYIYDSIKIHTCDSLREFLLDFISIIPDQIVRNNGDEIYNSACSIFSPFIFEYIHPESGQIFLPANSYQLQQMESFVETFTSMVLPIIARFTPHILLYFFQLYLYRIRINLPLDQIQLFEKSFSQLPWYNVLFLPNHLSELYQIIENDNRTTIQNSCCSIINQLNWKYIEQYVLNSWNPDQLSNFYSLSLELLIFKSLILNDTVRSFKITDSDLQWKYLNTEDYDRITVKTSWFSKEYSSPSKLTNCLNYISIAAHHDGSTYNYKKPAVFARLFFGLLEMFQISEKKNTSLFLWYIQEECYKTLSYQFELLSPYRNTEICIESLKSYTAIVNFDAKWSKTYIEKMSDLIINNFPVLKESFLTSLECIYQIGAFCNLLEKIVSNLISSNQIQFLSKVPIFGDQLSLMNECMGKGYWLALYVEFHKLYIQYPEDAKIRMNLVDCILKIKQQPKGDRNDFILLYKLYFYIISKTSLDGSIKKETLDLSQHFLQIAFSRSILSRITRTKISKSLQVLFGVMILLLLRYGSHSIKEAKEAIGMNYPLEIQSLLLRAETMDFTNENTIYHIFEAVSRHLIPNDLSILSESKM